MKTANRFRRVAFTLIELMISMSLVVFIVTVVAGMTNTAARVWNNGERTVETNQTGRALLEMMGREISQAVMSPKLQFVQDPILPADANQRASSGSVFWVAPLSSTSQGDLCEVGYYLTDHCELKRFFVPPSDTNNYQILTTMPVDYTPRPTGNSGGVNDHANAALWVTDFVTKPDPAGRTVSSTVAGGVLYFSIRCLDSNGDPIPWLDTKLKYNSSEPMQSAMPDARGSSTSSPNNPSSFIYTYYNAASASDPQNTIPANLLPYAVELTIVTTDQKSLQRLGLSAVPPTPPIGSAYLQRNPSLPGVLPLAPLAIPDSTSLFVQNAQTAGFRDVRSFSTVVRLRNAAP